MLARAVPWHTERHNRAAAAPRSLICRRFRAGEVNDTAQRPQTWGAGVSMSLAPHKVTVLWICLFDPAKSSNSARLANKAKCFGSRQNASDSPSKLFPFQ